MFAQFAEIWDPAFLIFRAQLHARRHCLVDSWAPVYFGQGSLNFEILNHRHHHHWNERVLVQILAAKGSLA